MFLFLSLFPKEIKAKYQSYDDQFQALIQTGHTLTKQLKDGNRQHSNYHIVFKVISLLLENQNSTEHEVSLKTLEDRWLELYQQILRSEKDLELNLITNELDALTQQRNEIQIWLDTVPPSSTSRTELEVLIKKTRELFLFCFINSINLITSSGRVDN